MNQTANGKLEDEQQKRAWLLLNQTFHEDLHRALEEGEVVVHELYGRLYICQRPHANRLESDVEIAPLLLPLITYKNNPGRLQYHSPKLILRGNSHSCQWGKCTEEGLEVVEPLTGPFNPNFAISLRNISTRAGNCSALQLICGYQMAQYHHHFPTHLERYKTSRYLLEVSPNWAMLMEECGRSQCFICQPCEPVY